MTNDIPRLAHDVVVDGRRMLIYGPDYQRAVEMFQQSRELHNLARASSITPFQIREVAHEEV